MFSAVFSVLLEGMEDQGWGGGNILQSVLSKAAFGGISNWGCLVLGLVWSVPLSFKGNDRESPKRGGGRIVGGGFQTKKPPCPSFPWSFSKHQGRPQKHQGFFSPCEPLKTLENKQKTQKDQGNLQQEKHQGNKNTKEKKDRGLTRVSKRVPGVQGKRGLERGWQKRLAKGWRRVGEGLADLLAPSNFAILEAPV